MSKNKNTITVHPELTIGRYADTTVKLPRPVQEHVKALMHLGETLEANDDLSADAGTFAKTFALRHDIGYGSRLDIFSSNGARRILNGALDAVDALAGSGEVINYLSVNKDHYAASRIIGHGVLGLVENSLYFQEALRLPRAKSIGLAAILAAHHPGVPITMVSGFLRDKALIQPHLQSAFFINHNTQDPEVARQKLAAYGADQLGIPRGDGMRAAVLGYALDRISAGQAPQGIELKDGTVEISGGEVMQKKYGLVAGDLIRDAEVENPSIELLYDTVNRRLSKEARAAIAAAERINDKPLAAFTTEQANAVIGATSHYQNKALHALHERGFSGEFSQLAGERDALVRYVKTTQDPNLLYALASYDAVLSAH